MWEEAGSYRVVFSRIIDQLRDFHVETVSVKHELWWFLPTHWKLSTEQRFVHPCGLISSAPCPQRKFNGHSYCEYLKNHGRHKSYWSRQTHFGCRPLIVGFAARKINSASTFQWQNFGLDFSVNRHAGSLCKFCLESNRSYRSCLPKNKKKIELTFLSKPILRPAVMPSANWTRQAMYV